jgi:riboflavin kinase/FMN adenylyltransferase
MKLIRSATELTGHRKVCAAIGVFDGVHLGHQQIIRQTIGDARQFEATSVVVTFDRHPNAIVAPAHVPPLIYSLPQKLRTIESLGAEAVLLIPFDRAFSEQSGEAFIRGLARDFGHLQSLCVGADFVFGHKRGGNTQLLGALGRELNFTVHGMAAVSLDGQAVSSTRIRDAIRVGNFDDASQMLGRAYSLAGTIIRGDEVGRKLGFPTANVDFKGLIIPPTGVYSAHVTVRGERHRAVLNIGRRPTLEMPDPQLRVEVHVLNFEGDLYGQEMEVEFVKKLRDEKKFASVEELKAQISHDVAEALLSF